MTPVLFQTAPKLLLVNSINYTTELVCQFFRFYRTQKLFFGVNLLFLELSSAVDDARWLQRWRLSFVCAFLCSFASKRHKPSQELTDSPMSQRNGSGWFADRWHSRVPWGFYARALFAVHCLPDSWGMLFHGPQITTFRL